MSTILGLVLLLVVTAAVFAAVPFILAPFVLTTAWLQRRRDLVPAIDSPATQTAQPEPVVGEDHLPVIASTRQAQAA
ncbi:MULTISPECIES: hypothetical protein [unclassified Luteococcus]|uniref:hypothetical protein n=1 Tax=unclassified Luteococcus TaxID=2639923 RepID=UPI00313D2AFA